MNKFKIGDHVWFCTPGVLQGPFQVVSINLDNSRNVTYGIRWANNTTNNSAHSNGVSESSLVRLTNFRKALSVFSKSYIKKGVSIRIDRYVDNFNAPPVQ